MGNDEENKELDLSDKNEDSEEVIKEDEGSQDDNQEESKQGDYQGKLNATNRFLKKEGYEFKDGKWNKPVVVEDKKTVESAVVTDNLSSKDILALTKANLHEDDLDSVLEWANFKKISVADALKSDHVTTLLETKAEKRKSAEMAITKNTRRGQDKPSGETLVKNLSEGKIPEAGSNDAEELFWARRGGRRS